MSTRHGCDMVLMSGCQAFSFFLMRFLFHVHWELVDLASCTAQEQVAAEFGWEDVYNGRAVHAAPCPKVIHFLLALEIFACHNHACKHLKVYTCSLGVC